MSSRDYTEPNVCVDENLTTNDAGGLIVQPYAIVRRVANVKGPSGGDGRFTGPEIALPGKLLIDIPSVGWRNDSPLPVMILIRIIRASKSIVTSNPNAIQFRDRWTYTVDADDVKPTVPLTTGIYNSQCGIAADLGTNTVAEPNPGLQWVWFDGNTSDEWIETPCMPGDKVNLWYREYVWTPPPYSDNANKNAPQMIATAGWTRVELWAFPMPGNLVNG